jgi:hypothetical protein
LENGKNGTKLVHAKKMERNLHEKTSWWKMYAKRLFFEDLEVRDVGMYCKLFGRYFNVY